MRFLADECCDFTIVKALRSAGFEVLLAADSGPGAADEVIIDLALEEESILITEDKDFGRLLFAYGLETMGVIFLRYPHSARIQVAEELVEFIHQQGKRINGSFVTVQPGRIRIGRIPTDS